MNYLMVAIGAAAGGLTRYWLSEFIQKVFPGILPYGTLSVNIFGGILIGFIMFNIDTGTIISPTMKLVLTVGFCGGLTTFSAFSYETVTMLTNSEYSSAIINVVMNVFLAIFATFFGLLIAKLLSGFSVFFGTN